MSHGALSRKNNRHNFTSSNTLLHAEGTHTSPFAKAKGGGGAALQVVEGPTATKLEGSLRKEMAKTELASKLKSRASMSSMTSLTASQNGKELDEASVASKASGMDPDADDAGEGDADEDYGDVTYDWRFDGPDGDRENDAQLASLPTVAASPDKSRNGLSKTYGSAYSLASLKSSLSGDLQERSLRTVRSLQQMTMSAASSFAQSVATFGEPEPETLIARNESFMKLHSLKAPPSPIQRRREAEAAVLATEEKKTLGPKTSSFLASVDTVMSTLGTYRGVTVAPPKTEDRPVTRDDVFPQGAHAIKFEPKQPAPPESEYRTLFDVQKARSFRLESSKNNSPLPATRSHGKLLPLQNPPATAPPSSEKPVAISPYPPRSPGLKTLMGSGILRPPPLNLSVTPGGSNVHGRSYNDLSTVGGLGGGRPGPPLMSPISNRGVGSSHTPKSGGGGGSSSPTAAISSAFLQQALKKTSSYLTMPLPMLALTPDKQQQHDVALASSSGGGTIAGSLLKSTASFLGLQSLQTSPVMASTPKRSESSPKTPKSEGLLSERHKKVIADAAPGVGTPVIYVPQTARSEASEAASIFSNKTGLLEVGSTKAGRFQPASLKHLDLSKVAEAPHDAASASKFKIEVPDVGPDNPVKQLDETWAACWDDEAGAVYYYNQETGEATWLPPKLDSNEDAQDNDDGDFFRQLNSGLPRGLSEFKLGDSELTIKTRKIAARHKLWSKLRNRYEGDSATEFSSALEEKDKAHYSKLEDSEILWEYSKEISEWMID